MDNKSWQDALVARDDLQQYGDNSIGLFALALRFSVDDIHSVAAELTFPLRIEPLQTE